MADEDEEAEEAPKLNATLQRALGKTKRPTKHARITTRTPEEVARDFMVDSLAAQSSSIQREGDAAVRLSAVESGKAVFAESAGRLTVVFRALRHDVEERVQLLSRSEVLAALRAVASRGSSSRRGAGSSALLRPHALALRSPTLFWCAAHAFGTAEEALKAAKDS